MNGFGGEAHCLIEDVRRARSRLRRLSDAYIFAADKFQMLHVAKAQFDELESAISLLPTELRDRSWVIGMERGL